MSTFNGIVSEFADIRIDFFRRQPDAPPPLACFLSHVHSDHLMGLESLRSPFVYCSAATREILLRLERYPCRINYAKGILEARQQTYNHLSKILKPLPLETPTDLELRPGYTIQVTLFDANHCPGSVMFLIEGQGKAILYTGDTRSEPWFVNKLARSPTLVEYTSGIKTLDKLYLDTSFTGDIPFQTKSEGLAELLRKVANYPDDTIFHFQAWTYGYEDVWIALSKTLKSPIHVDEYKYRIYNAIKLHSNDGNSMAYLHTTPEAPALTGFICGNSPRKGCLTLHENVRLHSCERGNMCTVAQGPDVVRILPVVAHVPGIGDIAEAGVGGGGSDLQREAELEGLSQCDIQELVDMILAFSDLSSAAYADTRQKLMQTAEGGLHSLLDLDIAAFGDDFSMTFERAVKSFIDDATREPKGGQDPDQRGSKSLPRTICFPYSRHSSYRELCHLVEIFRPKDIWPCTVDPENWIRDGTTMRSLFGSYCCTDVFEHDIKMEALAEREAIAERKAVQSEDSQQTYHSAPLLESSPIRISIEENSSPAPGARHSLPAQQDTEFMRGRIVSPTTESVSEMTSPFVAHSKKNETHTAEPNASNDANEAERHSSAKRLYEDFAAEEKVQGGNSESQQTEKSFTSAISMRHSRTRQETYRAVLEASEHGDLGDIGLISTGDNHTVMEREL